MARSALRVGSGASSSSSPMSSNARPKVITPTRPIIMAIMIIPLPHALNWGVKSIVIPAVPRAATASKTRFRNGLPSSVKESQNRQINSKMA